MRVRGFKVAVRTNDGSTPPGMGDIYRALSEAELSCKFDIVIRELEGDEADGMFGARSCNDVSGTDSCWS